MTHAKPRLSRLRDIGWSLWDPIGVADVAGWKDSSAADEYDTYLLHTVSMLQRGTGEEECVQYLVAIEAEHMGLGVRDETHPRAMRTVSAIRQYLGGLPDEPEGDR